MNTISIIGLGYIGLPTATVLASRKKRVIGVDVSTNVVDTINRGNIHIVEPELDILVHAAVGSGYLKATTKPEPADVFLIAVPTPLAKGNRPDLSHIRSAVQSIAPVLAKGNLVLLESTSPVGTTENVAEWLADARPDLSFPQQQGEASDIRVAYCPERVLPGRIIHEIVANDRVVGGMTPRCSQSAVEFYQLFVQGECIVTTARTAEMCKLAENSFRDVNIAFANELSMICDKQDVNVWELIKLANRHPRVNILQPGCGVGGHCIAVDPWFVVDSTPEEARLIRTAREVNDAKPEWVIAKVEKAIEELVTTPMEVKDIRIACLGITFKPDIDDVRESPALHITERLAIEYPGQVFVVEPNLSALPLRLMQEQVRQKSLEEALFSSNILILLVDHAAFKQMEPVLRPGMIVIDTRGIWGSKSEFRI